jgi:hypothetical protein
MSPSFTKPKPVRVSKLSSMAVALPRESILSDQVATATTQISSPHRKGSDNPQPGFEDHIKRVVEKFLSVDILVKIMQSRATESADSDSDTSFTSIDSSDDGQTPKRSRVSELAGSLTRQHMRPRLASRAAPKRSK